MHFAAICPKAYSDEIMTARKGILSRWGATSIDQHSSPLDYGHYIGMFLNEGSKELIGFSEYYLYRDLEDGYGASYIQQHVDLRTIGRVKTMAHIRTIYLMPAYRRRFGDYVSLYAYTAQDAIIHGIEQTTLSTHLHDTELQRLYVRMGGTRIATFNPPQLLDGITVYVLHLADLLSQPVARRCMRKVGPSR